MKVLFINRFLSKEAIYREPLGLLMLSGMIREKHDVFIVEPRAENLHAKIQDIQPDVIAYSLRTGFHNESLELNKELKKEYSFLSVFGGPHPTFFPEVIEEEGVDVICRGEGEEAFLELLDKMDAGEEITDIENLWVRQSGTVHKNNIRPLVQNLDTLPFPDRDLLEGYEEISMAKTRSFITGRGCPYNCTYCFNQRLKTLYAGEKYVRRRSVDNVIQEVREIKEKYGLEIAIFEDDTFNLNKAWLEEFCLKFKEMDVSFICIGVRADKMDDESAALLKAAGCLSVVFGIESGSADIRERMLSRQISDEAILNCAQALKRHGVNYTTENILAIPTSSLEDDLITLRLNMKCKPFFSVAQIMQPYPGTEIYDRSIELGLFKENDFSVLGSFTRASQLQIENRRERENLQRLFSITVSFPFLYPLLKVLIRLPLRPLYTFLHDIHKACIGVAWLPRKRSFREYALLIKRYFFY